MTDKAGGKSSEGTESAEQGGSKKSQRSSTKSHLRFVGIGVLVFCVLGFFFGIVPSFFVADGAAKYREKLEREMKVDVLRATTNIHKGSQIEGRSVTVDQQAKYLTPADALTSLSQLDGAVAAEDIYSTSVIRAKNVVYKKQQATEPEAVAKIKANFSHPHQK